MFKLSEESLLVIAPHPDDEVLGCAGLMSRIKKSGGKVYVLYLTVGTTADYSKTGKSTAADRIKEIERAAAFFELDGYDISFKGNEFHLQLDKLPLHNIINSLEAGTAVSINKIRPTIIATSQLTDYNQDHRACQLAVMAAVRPSPRKMKPYTPVVLGYEFAANGWGISNPSQPNFYVGLDDRDIGKKIEAMELYESQAREYPHTRSTEVIRSLAILRGSQSGTEFAESYVIYRISL